MRLRYLILAVVFTLLAVGLVIAQGPAQNVSGRRHPNLAAAQRLCEQAFTRITDAQKANEWDMKGHAAKAKDSSVLRIRIYDLR